MEGWVWADLGHLQSVGWSPSNQWMVTHQKEVYYRLGIWHEIIFLLSQGLATYYQKNSEPSDIGIGRAYVPPENSKTQEYLEKGHLLDQVHQARLLWVIISDDLTWKPNTDHIVKKTFKRMSTSSSFLSPSKNWCIFILSISGK